MINKYNIYNILLAILLFSLPISEATKQMALWLFVVTGIFIIVKDKTQIKFDLLNISFILFLVFTALSCIVNQTSIKVLFDPLRCVLFFIVLRILGVRYINIKLNIYALFAGFLTAFVLACIAKFTSNDPFAPLELKSIGHVNHSAIFMLLVLLVSLSFVDSKDKFLKSSCLVIAIISTCGILIAGSRATMYLLPVVIFSILIYLTIKKHINIKFTLSVISIFALAIIALAFVMQNDVRFVYKISQGISSNETRWPIFYSAFYTWQDNPFFGIGLGNFKDIDITTFFPGNSEVRVSHAHNTFLTFLTEKGIFALLAYLVFQLSLFIKFIKNIKTSNVVFCGLLMLLFNNVISLFNTTFHHENALLMLLFWALALGVIDEKNSIFKN